MVELKPATLPPASQKLGDAHDTACILTSVDPDGCGMRCTRHEVPFHCAARPRTSPPLVSYEPTASQKLAEVQEIVSRKADVEPLGAGKRCRVQAAPFQFSARVIAAVPTWWSPTASQKVAVGQDTPSSAGEVA